MTNFLSGTPRENASRRRVFIFLPHKVSSDLPHKVSSLGETSLRYFAGTPESFE